MSLTENETNLCNQALDRIGSKNFAYATQATVNVKEATKCENIYAQTRNALLRSFEWPFASERAELVNVQTLTLDTTPLDDPFAADDVIYGLNNGYSATIISATTDTEYEIMYLSGDFEDGEFLTNATVYKIYYDGILVEDEDEDEPILWCDTTDYDTVTCADLTLADSAPDFEWDYQFKLPDDFLRLRSNYTIDDSNAVDDRFMIEGDYLLTNEDEVDLKYIKKVTDPDDFDPLFTEVLILTLAKKLIPALAGTKSPTLLEDVGRDLASALSHARAVCRQETNVSGRSDWRQARHSVNTSSV